MIEEKTDPIKTTVWLSTTKITVLVERVLNKETYQEFHTFPLVNINMLTYYPRDNFLELELLSDESYGFTNIDRISYSPNKPE